MSVKHTNIFVLLTFLILLFLTFECIAQKKAHRRFLKDPDFIIEPSTPVILEDALKPFNDSNNNAEYRITLCVDVPYNKNPMKVLYQLEPGHVFLILQKINKIITDTIHEVFGFYPKKKLPVFFARRVKSQVKDNSRREYDVALSKMLTKEQFQMVIDVALKYSHAEYHLNRFNCYDYAMQIFNTVAGSDKLTPKYVKFPFPFGKGGSPCGLYKYMMQMKDSTTVWTPYIEFGNLVAPKSTKLKEQLLGKTNVMINAFIPAVK